MSSPTTTDENDESITTRTSNDDTSCSTPTVVTVVDLATTNNTIVEDTDTMNDNEFKVMPPKKPQRHESPTLSSSNSEHENTLYQYNVWPYAYCNVQQQNHNQQQLLSDIRYQFIIIMSNLIQLIISCGFTLHIAFDVIDYSSQLIIMGCMTIIIALQLLTFTLMLIILRNYIKYRNENLLLARVIVRNEKLQDRVWMITPFQIVLCIVVFIYQACIAPNTV